jgi:hypothetical protein
MTYSTASVLDLFSQLLNYLGPLPVGTSRGSRDSLLAPNDPHMPGPLHVWGLASFFGVQF